jgi:protoporphyrinogen/coproporphyrinogen III oxidase
MENERVAVIGGGPAGLSAARRLQEAGKRVTLYEARGEVGGKLRSDVLDGAVVDVAVQLLSSTYGTLRRLVEASGLGHLLVASPGRDAVWRGGRAHSLTYGSVASLVASGALPAALKLRMGAKYLPFLAGRARGLDANDPAHTGGPSLDDESIEAWGRRELGDDFVELLAYPLLAAYYGSPPERVSAAVYHALAKVGMEVRLYAARDGMGRLAGGIGEGIVRLGGEIRTSTRVSGVEAEADGVVVRTEEGEERYAAAVVAVPAPTALRLLSAELPQRTLLEAVEVVPATTVALLTGRPIDADFFGLSFPRYTEAGQQIVAACVERRKAPGFVPPGKGLLVVFPSPAVSARAVGAKPQQVVDWILPAVEQAFPGMAGTVERARVYQFDEGYTVFYPGYLRDLEAADPTPWRGVALAGDYWVAPTVEGAVISGLRAAERLLSAG